MGRAQDPTGDYGYDLAHDDVVPAPSRTETPGVEPTPSGAAAADPSGDYGYDEAHDF